MKSGTQVGVFCFGFQEAPRIDVFELNATLDEALLRKKTSGKKTNRKNPRST